MSGYEPGPINKLDLSKEFHRSLRMFSLNEAFLTQAAQCTHPDCIDQKFKFEWQYND